MRFLDAPLVMTGFFALQLVATWWFGRWGIGWLWAMHLLLNNGTWLVNSVCHWPDVGTAPGATGDRSRNVAWLSYVTRGESNHNYHHEFPTSACHGIRGKSDSSWKVIQLLGKLGLAWEIQLPEGHPDKARWENSAKDRACDVRQHPRTDQSRQRMRLGLTPRPRTRDLNAEVPSCW